MKILVTGTAGFIGSFVARRLLERGDQVVGIDSVNSYYDRRLKLARLENGGIPTENLHYGTALTSRKYAGYTFIQLDITEKGLIHNLFREHGFDAVCHLAAQAGVRYSTENPYAYADSNLSGFLNILEGCRRFPVRHLVYASSSSVYGANTKVPYSEDDRTDSPESLYAATKKADEAMAEAYSRLYGIAATGLRFFTVYGPWGRPDMAPMIFTRAILAGEPVKVYNHGKQSRDFTYIDDIVEGIVRVVAGSCGRDPVHTIYNIGNGCPVKLMDFIRCLESELGTNAVMEMLPAQPGDMSVTWADCSKLERDFGYRPRTALEDGIRRFVEWYRKENPCK